MLRALLLTLALLLLGGVAQPASAGTGMPVLKHGIQGPTANELFADRIDEAVKRDPTGHALIKDGVGDYSPVRVYESLRVLHPELGFVNPKPAAADFKQMTDYIRTLEFGTLDEDGTYRDTRYLCPPGSACTFDLSWSRVFKKGAKVWKDRNTGQPIFSENCGNTMAPPAPPPPPTPQCAFYVFEARDTGYAHVSALGNMTAEEEAACPIGFQGPGTGTNGRSFDLGGYKPLADCPDHPCDWRSAVAFYKLPIYRTGAFKITPGWWAIRVPIRFAHDMNLRLVACLTDSQGRPTHIMGALPALYIPDASGTPIYTLYDREDEIPASYQALYRNLGVESAHWRWLHEERQQLAAR